MFIVNVEVALYRERKWLIIERNDPDTHANGALAFVGGKVKLAHHDADILERTARREVMEEVGLEVSGPFHYVHSTLSAMDSGEPVINILFLCEAGEGKPYLASPEEIANLSWMTTEEALSHPRTPAYTKENVRRAERLRRSMNHAQEVSY
ncbi:NUDIX hydrolase [Paenibacillus mendelii]|uniref:NUDIX hydrolase n=1 Tax=Paenibacillus mendelii TaxID=206163 RepID=A0ABV6JJM8_9BACL|nr:NUDIX domain-containing protein [Paenibacillus mendelii]MCQ6559053.1 NUDIX domain-containing protein [Paenibacillus mendelii]